MVTQPLRAAELAVTHLARIYGEDSRPVVLPAEDAFLVVLYLTDADHCDLWPDRPPLPVKRYSKGSICVISLKHGAAISIRGAFEALAFHIPNAHFAELADDAGEPLIDDLVICRGIEDHIVRNIGAALMPLFDTPEEVRDRLLIHVGLAFNTHIAHRYGRSRRVH